MTGDDAERARPNASRRRWLVTVGTALTAALAGCPANSGDAGEPDTTASTETTTATETASATRTRTPTATQTTSSRLTATAAKEIVREFYTAADDGEFERANALVHPESPEGTIGANQQTFFERQTIAVQGMTVLTAGTDRTTLRVTLRLSRNERERTEVTEIELRAHDGAWRLYRTG